MAEDEEQATGDSKEMRSLALTPTWSVATVLTVFVVVSLIVERSIHRLSNWLRKTNRKPLLAAVEKMKEELMLLGFISLFLTATSSLIANICIPSKFYNSSFAPCTRAQIDEEMEENSSQGRKLLMLSGTHFRRVLNSLEQNTCHKGHEPFVSYQGLEQLHRFIFVMAITHISYSCLTMLLAIVKIHRWRLWELEAYMDRHDVLTEITREKTFQRQTTFIGHVPSSPFAKSRLFMWVFNSTADLFLPAIWAFSCAIRLLDSPQRLYHVQNHHLSARYDFHSYMIRSMEEEFPSIVGVSGPLWGFVVAFMLFNIKGSNLYFWIAIIPITVKAICLLLLVQLVLLVGTKLQHVIATLTLENAGISGYFAGAKLKPRDDLFWFKKPELLLSLIHFILFQWQFGYNSCFIRNHTLVYIRLILGFAGQFLCSYSTLPLYALVTQMGTNYKAALIPQMIRETIHGWGKAARRKRRHGFMDDSTIRTDTSTVMSLEEDDHRCLDLAEATAHLGNDIELQPTSRTAETSPLGPVANETSSRAGTPLLRPSASSISSPIVSRIIAEDSFPRSSSMPTTTRR
ncbi:MLO-like protein 11 [Linum grandiflorum]